MFLSVSQIWATHWVTSFAKNSGVWSGRSSWSSADMPLHSGKLISSQINKVLTGTPQKLHTYFRVQVLSQFFFTAPDSFNLSNSKIAFHESMTYQWVSRYKNPLLASAYSLLDCGICTLARCFTHQLQTLSTSAIKTYYVRTVTIDRISSFGSCYSRPLFNQQRLLKKAKFGLKLRARHPDRDYLAQLTGQPLSHFWHYQYTDTQPRFSKSLPIRHEWAAH